MIRTRNDLNFYIITKRINRLHIGLPYDWGSGYENITICCTAENQNWADYRLPILLTEPIRHKSIIILSPYFGSFVGYLDLHIDWEVSKKIPQDLACGSNK